MLSQLRLVRYKGFQDCRIPLKGNAVLVGANNAGKSSAIGALRLIAALVPQSQRTNPSLASNTERGIWRGWPVTQAAVEASSFSSENVRNDFGEEEARIELLLSNGCELVVVWPERDAEDEDPIPTFHVIPPVSHSGPVRSAARDLIPSIGVVPTLAPLDDREPKIGPEALRRNVTGRRTSRYFRNALWVIHENQEEWANLLDYFYRHTPEVRNLNIRQVIAPKVNELDLFYTEPRSSHERELTWAGDGVQIWLQALFHLWRQRDSEVMVLDEPDVYLHPDLQRRLARLVLDADRQSVMATHSVEVLAEAPPGSAVWVDRSRRTAERAKRAGMLGLIGRRLGSGLELGIARALRSQIAVFVEGQDMRILTLLAKQLGAAAVASGSSYATVPLGGFTRNHVAGAFSEVITTLGGTVDVWVLLDRDLRSQAAVDDVVQDLKSRNVRVHVWKCRELENYLLSAEAISRLAGIPVNMADSLLAEAVAELEIECLIDLQEQRLRESDRNIGNTGRLANKSVLKDASSEFKKAWQDPTERLMIVDAKAVMKRLNVRLQAEGRPTVNSHSLARSIPPESVGEDLAGVVRDLEQRLAWQDTAMPR